MSKKVVVKRKADTQTTSSVNRFIESIAAWLRKRSRFVRSFLAGMVSLSFMTAIAMILYNILINTTPGSTLYSLLEEPNTLTILLIILSVIGVVFYGIGWRLLIGFDLGETQHEPGRPAAWWVFTGTVVFVVTIVLVVFTTLDAIQ